MTLGKVRRIPYHLVMLEMSHKQNIAKETTTESNKNSFQLSLSWSPNLQAIELFRCINWNRKIGLERCHENTRGEEKISTSMYRFCRHKWYIWLGYSLLVKWHPLFHSYNQKRQTASNKMRNDRNKETSKTSGNKQVHSSLNFICSPAKIQLLFPEGNVNRYSTLSGT